VPQSQAAPIAQQPSPRGNGGGLFNPGGGRPLNEVPSGGTRRPAPGAGTGGWTLNTGAAQSPGAGYDGLNLDVRCREDDRTHLDCPEYIRRQKGRDAEGFESISAHRNTASPTPPRRNSARDLTIGGLDPTGNAASTQILDDAGISSRSRALTGDEAEPNRVRDILNPTPKTPDWTIGNDVPTQPFNPNNQSSPPTGTNTENDWIFKPPSSNSNTANLGLSHK